ncbi:TPA: YopX family protein [Streptococcus suis]
MIPKFRAWDVHNKKMLVVNDICNLFWENTFFECYELVPDPKGKREYELINHRIDFEDCVLMQSTGLFDKNGKEIFEDDVVKSTWFNDYDDCVGYRKEGTVVYRNGYFGIEYPGDVEKGYSPTILDFAVSVEIIGNIHQNPELLEG